MCGRYTLSSPGQLVAELCELADVPSVAPRYNIAPTQESLIVRSSREGDRRVAATARWGLIPYWADDPAIGNRTINARSETAADKPAYRASFRRKRCLVPADGFYEWRPFGGSKQPYHIRLSSREPFVFAGLWDRWLADDDRIVDSFTVLTTAANRLVEPIHDRMPVILTHDRHADWLDLETPEPHDLLRPLGEGNLEAVAVDLLVNDPRNDSPACLQEVPEPRLLF